MRCFNYMFPPASPADAEEWASEQWHEQVALPANTSGLYGFACHSVEGRCSVEVHFCKEVRDVEVAYRGPVRFDLSVARSARAAVQDTSIASIATGCYVDLTGDLRVLICRHTAGRFVVETESFSYNRDILPGERLQIRWILRLEFELKPRTASDYPEISVKMSETLDPAYRHSQEFAQLHEAKVQQLETFVRTHEAKYRRTTSKINKVCVEVDFKEAWFGHFEFFEFRPLPHQLDEIPILQDWMPVVERGMIDEVREKLKSVFNMDLDMRRGPQEKSIF